MSNEIETSNVSSPLINGLCEANIAYLKQTEPADFFGCLLVSQIETIEAVNNLDKQFSSVVNKTILMENLVGITLHKFSAIEETMRIFMKQFESMNLTTQEMNNKEAAQLSSLGEVCSELHEKEHEKVVSPEKKYEPVSPQLSTEPVKEETIPKKELCFEHSACFYCKEHSKYLTDQKLPLLISDSESNEFKEIQRQFNKRVKYEVNKKFGSFYLAEHQVRELDVKEMHRIRKKVLRLFKPFPIPIKMAWNNAMNSLRQDRHQLKKKGRFLYRK